ncbi:MAG: hypothetical protein WD176_09145 [Pirellulales bacterium]
MNEPARILLVTPEPVTIDPPTDRITAFRGQPTDWSEVVQHMSGFTHLAVGPIGGEVASDLLLKAVDAELVSIFALPGYEWIELIADRPQILRGVTHALDGLVVVAPTSMIPASKPPDWLADLGYRLASPLLDMLPLDVERRLVRSDRPVSRSLKPFKPPLLSPRSLAAEADSARSTNAARNRLSQLSSDTTTLMAGWFQINDDLDASHTLAQSIEGHPDGDYWHAIMHRREPDYGNSKYWFRHVGRHPVFADLAPRAAQILHDAPPDVHSQWSGRLNVDSGWDPSAFVDMCQQAAADEEDNLGRTARRIQWIEMLLLLRHCARSA